MTSEVVEEKGLVVIENSNAMEIFTKEKGLDPLLEKIKEEVASFIPDATTKKGRAEIKRMTTKVVSSKTYLDGIGKKLVAELKEKPKLIDTERRRVREELDKLRDSVRKPLTDWETTEKERVERHYANIEEIKNMKSKCPEGTSTSTLSGILSMLTNITIDETWEEFEEAGQTWHDDLRHYLLDRIKTRKAYEDQQEELEELRREKEEREAEEKLKLEAKEKKENDERISREATEKAEREAKEKSEAEAKEAKEREQKLKDDKEKAEREKKEAEDKAEKDRIAQEEKIERDKREASEKAERDKQKAIDDERKRVEAENEKKEAAENKRQANLDHQRAVNNIILDKLKENGFSEKIAKEIIGLAATGQLGNLIVSY